MKNFGEVVEISNSFNLFKKISLLSLFIIFSVQLSTLLYGFTELQSF